MLKIVFVLILISQVIAIPIDNDKLIIEKQASLSSFNLTSEYLMTGKTVGSILQYIVLYENSFCFVTRSKSLTNTERCRVTYNYKNDDVRLWWTAEFISNNDNYECGVRCVIMNN